MSSKNPVNPMGVMSNPERKWFEVSEDELHHRMFAQSVMHNEPLTKAGALVAEALDRVLFTMGVEIDKDIEVQLDLLGIHTLGMGEDWPEDCRGVTVFKEKDDGPYAWIRDPVVDGNGDIVLEVWKYLPKQEQWVLRCGVNVGKLADKL